MSVTSIPDSELIRRAIVNVCPDSSRRWRYPLWVHVRDLFGVGSNYAAELCVIHGFNPDAAHRSEMKEQKP